MHAPQVPLSDGVVVRRAWGEEDAPAGAAGLNDACSRCTSSCSAGCATPPPTRQYAQRRTTEGQSKPEIIRCLNTHGVQAPGPPTCAALLMM